ncbi:MAG: phosphocholine cytidylyltransferase family protein [Pseudohongiellaceae bacterium]
MRAVILAAGQGSRLRPLTDDRPKGMVELAGRPLLHRQIEVLRAAGVEDIVLVSGYRGDQLRMPGVRIMENPRYAETNMVTTLFCAEQALRDAGDDVLISYADIVYEPRVLQSVLECRAPLCVAVDREWRAFWQLRMDDPLSDAETLRLADGDRITELGKKPGSYEDIQGQYMGLMKVRGDHVAEFCDTWHGMDREARYDGKDFDNMYLTSYLQHLIDSGWDMRAAFTDNGWLEVDTVEDLARYESMQQDGTLRPFIRLSP